MRRMKVELYPHQIFGEKYPPRLSLYCSWQSEGKKSAHRHQRRTSQSLLWACLDRWPQTTVLGVRTYPSARPTDRQLACSFQSLVVRAAAVRMACASTINREQTYCLLPARKRRPTDRPTADLFPFRVGPPLCSNCQLISLNAVGIAKLFKKYSTRTLGWITLSAYFVGRQLDGGPAGPLLPSCHLFKSASRLSLSSFSFWPHSS